MSNEKHECCTPKGQIPRYLDCIGCDRKPIHTPIMKQSSIEWLVSILNKPGFEPVLTEAEIQQATSMQQEQAQLYATFVLRCVRENLPPITFNDWIKLWPV